jgi:hypothetical protein
MFEEQDALAPRMWRWQLLSLQLLSLQPANGLGFVGKEAVGKGQVLCLSANGVHGQAGKHVMGLHHGAVAILPVHNGTRQPVLPEVDLLSRRVGRHRALVKEQLAQAIARKGPCHVVKQGRELVGKQTNR